MADKLISQANAPADDPNVRRNDLVLVDRGGVGYKAVVDGVKFVPDTGAADHRKVLEVQANGVPQFTLPGANTLTSETVWTGTISNAASGQTETLNTGKVWSTYEFIVFDFEFQGLVPGFLPDRHIVPRVVFDANAAGVLYERLNLLVYLQRTTANSFTVTTGSTLNSQAGGSLRLVAVRGLKR